MAVTFTDYLRFMQTASIFEPIARFEFLNPDETAYASFSGEVTGGSLSINRANGVRRSCSINVNNIYDAFTPNVLTFWINQKFKLYLGYRINGEDYFIPQGVFGVSNPKTTHMVSEKSAMISGVDKFGFLNGQLGGRFSSSYNVPVSSNLVDVLKATLLESAINDPVVPFLLIDNSIITPNTITEAYGQTYADLLLDLNDIVSYNMYYNNNGRFTCEPDILNSDKDSKWDFNANSRIYLGIEQNYDFDGAYNIVKVVGDNVNGDLATGIARNDDPSSPLSTLRIGDKLAPIITSTVIATDQQAQDRANYELARYTALSINANIQSVPLFHLDVDTIVTVMDRDAKLDGERFLINNLDFSFSPKDQSMSISATKANDLDFEVTNS